MVRDIAYGEAIVEREPRAARALLRRPLIERFRFVDPPLIDQQTNDIDHSGDERVPFEPQALDNPVEEMWRREKGKSYRSLDTPSERLRSACPCN